jgi:hypothetical protein
MSTRKVVSERRKWLNFWLLIGSAVVGVLAVFVLIGWTS